MNFDDAVYMLDKARSAALYIIPGLEPGKVADRFKVALSSLDGVANWLSSDGSGKHVLTSVQYDMLEAALHKVSVEFEEKLVSLCKSWTRI